MRRSGDDYYHERNLPHILPPGATFFVTCRLADSIPQEVRERWKAEDRLLESLAGRLQAEEYELRRGEARRHRFRDAESHLDSAASGPTWLTDERVAATVAESLGWVAANRAGVHAWCIMPNHLHLLLTPRQPGDEVDDPAVSPLSSVMHSFKGFTAKQANRVLGRDGRFWQHESYDHVVRNGREFEKMVAYILNNPVRARLVEEPDQWRWSYSQYEM